MIETRVVSSLADFDTLTSEWQELVQNSAGGSEMMHDASVVRLALTDPTTLSAPKFVIVRQDGQVICIAPFYLETAKVPLRLSVLQVAAFRARVLRLFGDRMIVRKGIEPRACFEAVFRALKEIRRDFDLLWIFTQRLDDPLWGHLTSPETRPKPFRAVVTSPHPEKVHVLSLNRTFDQYLAEIRKRTGFPGKSIRKFWRDFGATCAVRMISQPDDVPAFLAEVDRVYNASWQGRTYGHRQRNSPQDVARMEALASLGCLRSYLLAENGVGMAFVVGQQYRGRYTYSETAYDSSRSALSPGSVLTHAVIEDLFRTDIPEVLDFGFGDGAYKRTFGTSSYDVCSLYVVRPGLWRTLLAAQQTLNASYEVVRALLIRTRLDGAIRRLLKRQR